MTVQGDPATHWQEPYRPAAPEPGPQPGSVLAAGVIMIVMGVLIGIIGLIFVLSISIMSSVSDPAIFGPGFEDAFAPGELEASMNLVGGLIVVFAIIALLMAGAHLVGGIGILRRRTWGRITGLVLSFLAVLILVIGIVSTIVTLGQPVPFPETVGFDEEQLEQMAWSGAVVSLIITAIFIAAYAFVAIILLRRGDAFGD